jgi:hypothetical protein
VKKEVGVRVVKVGFDEYRAPDEPEHQAEDAQPKPAAEYPLVLVAWHDAWFDLDQSDPDDCRPDYLVRTVGFLVSEGPRFLSIAQEVLPDGDGFRAVTHIPVSIVESVTPLGTSGPSRRTTTGAG